RAAGGRGAPSRSVLREGLAKIPALTAPGRRRPAAGEDTEVMNPGTDAAAGRVLVVDDEKPLAQMVATYLTRGGYEVATVHTGPDAVEAARDRSPDVVVLDLGLPGMDGIEVCRRIRGF